MRATSCSACTTTGSAMSRSGCAAPTSIGSRPSPKSRRRRATSPRRCGGPSSSSPPTRSNETGYRRLMRLLGSTDRARALPPITCVCVPSTTSSVSDPAPRRPRLYETLVAEQPVAAGRVPVAPPQRSPLIGRDLEWAVLTATATQALAGAGVMVLVSGEPGIGKSRLVDELVTWATRREASCVTARAFQAEGRATIRPDRRAPAAAGVRRCAGAPRRRLAVRGRPAAAGAEFRGGASGSCGSRPSARPSPAPWRGRVGRWSS